MLTTLDDDMPVAGASGVSPDCQAQLIPDSMTGARYMELRTKQDRKPFEPWWDEAVQMIRAGKFRRMLDLATYFGKKPEWSTKFKELAVKQRVFTIEEWKSCFQRGHSLGRPIEDCRTWEERQQQEQVQQLVQPVIEQEEEEEPYFVTHRGNAEPYSLVLERVRQREFLSVNSICRFYYACRPKHVEALRQYVIQRGLVTEQQWLDLLKRRTRRRPVSNQVTTVNREGERNDNAKTTTVTRITTE